MLALLCICSVTSRSQLPFLGAKFTVLNKCATAKTAHVKNADFNHVSAPFAPGKSYTVTVPTRASSMIVFGESGQCPGIDGPVGSLFLYASDAVRVLIID